MLKKLALSLAALLLGLLAAEALVRLAGAAPEVAAVQKGRFRLSDNPRLGYEPVPLAYQGEDLAYYDYRGASNRLGYRDVDHEAEKPQGTYRIVVLGDSVGAGFGVERLEDTFPRRLEALLRERGIPAEVLNFSVSGYDTRQEVETLKTRALAFAPDLVLLAYCLNDRERNDGDILATLLAEQQARGAMPSSAATSHPLLLRSALYRFLRFRAFPPGQVSAQTPGLATGAPATSPLPLAGEGQGEGGSDQDPVAEAFAELAALRTRHGFEVLVTVFPKLQGERRPAEHAYAQDLSTRHGFRHLDLRAAFRACRQATPEPVDIDSYHPTAAGHRCAAAAMAKAISAGRRR
ncbi:MAG TPA: SGNH/GDSL hydrolase family protein [Thermoanaerobaculia bacterium]|nr:SGNH/GDSL hydrolase family protein [Thermoanaerobaculia bacterium]